MFLSFQRCNFAIIIIKICIVAVVDVSDGDGAADVIIKLINFHKNP